MKVWKKGAIVGGVWGLISFLELAFRAIQSVMANSSRPLSISLTEKVVLLPGYLVTSVVKLLKTNPSFSVLYTKSGLIGILFFLLLSMTLGALIIIGISHGLKLAKLKRRG